MSRRLRSKRNEKRFLHIFRARSLVEACSAPAMVIIQSLLHAKDDPSEFWRLMEQLAPQPEHDRKNPTINWREERCNVGVMRTIPAAPDAAISDEDDE